MSETLWPMFRVLLAGFAASLILTGLVREISRRLDLMDRPGAHKQHLEATPTLGGLGVFG